jgi:hypothetical protein
MVGIMQVEATCQAGCDETGAETEPRLTFGVMRVDPCCGVKLARLTFGKFEHVLACPYAGSSQNEGTNVERLSIAENLHRVTISSVGKVNTNVDDGTRCRM